MKVAVALAVALAAHAAPSAQAARGLNGKSSKGSSGFKVSRKASEGFLHVLDVYTSGSCLGPDFGTGDREECASIGGYAVQAYHPDGTESDSGYCCPEFDVSDLKDMGCVKKDANDADGCGKVVHDETGKWSGGLQVAHDVDYTKATTGSYFCCPSGIDIGTRPDPPTTTTAATTTAGFSTPGPPVYLFRSRSLTVEPMNSVENRMTTIEGIGGNPDACHKGYGEALSAKQRADLRALVDAAFEEIVSDEAAPPDIHEDFRYDISAQQLLDVVGFATFQNIHKTFRDFENHPVTWLAIRKTSLSGDKHIQFHQDGTNFVMHVWLNEETDNVEGGNIVYLNRNGTELVDIVPGHAVLHGDRLVHGITNVYGTRYILILGGHDVNARDEMQAAMDGSLASEL